jgi:amidophosphoribosyltransferase
MCGILGFIHVNKMNFVNQSLVDGLTLLQHRGQDSAGIATLHNENIHMYKNKGVVSDVFNEETIFPLKGNIGIGHVRYSTLETSNIMEAQPLYTNVPYGIALVHNGNLTNTNELVDSMKEINRHIHSNSDSELLLNVFANELYNQNKELSMETKIFSSVRSIMQKCKGGFSVIIMINNVGIIAFRDPYGIRPLCFGNNKDGDYVIASESVVMDVLDSQFKLLRDVHPGECIFINMDYKLTSKIVVENSILKPCLFEYIYFARPDSVIDGISVYESRKNMGKKLAMNIHKEFREKKLTMDIDVVIPVPETSRISALEIANHLQIPYKEGFIKNRYITRTFILPGQEIRIKSLKLKINTIKSIFENKNILIVDDSIVRGTTSLQLVQLAKHAGAKKIYFSSAAPPVKYPNIYGINIPTTRELLAYNKTNEEIAELLGVTMVFYNSLDDVIESCTNNNGVRTPTEFETSCFNGKYIHI